jgi:hypothetical protein
MCSEGRDAVAGVGLVARAPRACLTETEFHEQSRRLTFQHFFLNFTPNCISHLSSGSFQGPAVEVSDRRAGNCANGSSFQEHPAIS